MISFMIELSAVNYPYSQLFIILSNVVSDTTIEYIEPAFILGLCWHLNVLLLYNQIKSTVGVLIVCVCARACTS
jgi:hypothetical protein